MADLLECVIQIKALRDTLDRTARLTERAERSAPWLPLAEAERRCAVALGTIGGAGAEPSRPDDGPAFQRERFATLRRANLAMLEGCSAAQLAGFVAWPGRPFTTVADLVAIMLANDTEALGELRRGRPEPEPRRPS
jgi:hypothetical protein